LQFKNVAGKQKEYITINCCTYYFDSCANGEGCSGHKSKGTVIAGGGGKISWLWMCDGRCVDQNQGTTNSQGIVKITLQNPRKNVFTGFRKTIPWEQLTTHHVLGNWDLMASFQWY
jgi:hypothetical protein